MRRIFSLVMIISILMYAGQPLLVEAGEQPRSVLASNITIKINGRVVDFEPKPFIFKGRLMVPVRTLGDNLGLPVGWSDAAHIVLIDDYGFQVIELKAGSNEIVIDSSRTIRTDVPMMLVDDSTMVPLRLIAELLGAKVTWDSSRNTAEVIYYGHSRPNALIGNDICRLDQAKAFVLAKGLLKNVSEASLTPLRFEEFGPTDTMVAGTDGSGEQKAVWVKLDESGGISVTYSILLKDVWSKDQLNKALEARNIEAIDILKEYLAPYDAANDLLCWYVIVRFTGGTGYFCFNARNGELVLEN